MRVSYLKEFRDNVPSGGYKLAPDLGPGLVNIILKPILVLKYYSLNRLTFKAVAPLGPFPISKVTTLFSFILSFKLLA